tara:strand:- start:9040 stop:10344 length:1305 start_codon:yes stop_codon:yes gene_type:complete
MANLLEGLFGLRPNLESQQENMQVDRGMGFGELLGRAGVNPYAPKAVQDAYLGRQAATGALVGKAMNTAAGLFGIETPELQRAKGMESILQQTQADTDLNNPAEFYPTLAKRMADAGFTQEAIQIGQVGAKAIQDFNLNTSAIAKDTAQTNKFKAEALAKLREKTDPLVATLLAAGLEEGSPEFITAMKAKVEKEIGRPTKTVETTGGILLIDEKTGETIQNLGQPVDRSSKVSVTNVQEANESLLTKEVYVPIAKAASEAATGARSFAQKAKVIASLLKGKGGGSIIKITSDIGRSLGFEGDTIIADDLANSLATVGATTIRATGSGSTSDIEFKAYVKAFPSLSNSEGGRELMAKYADKIADRQALLSDKTNELIKKGEYSASAINEYDNSLGPILGEDFKAAVKNPPASTFSQKSTVNNYVEQAKSAKGGS